jgi:hypothetical protein
MAMLSLKNGRVVDMYLPHNLTFKCLLKKLGGRYVPTSHAFKEFGEG